MSLLGTSFYVFWTDFRPDAEADLDLWHLREHFIERASVEGVLGARRYIARDRKKYRYLTLYELASTSVMKKDWVVSVNHPSPWTLKYRGNGLLDTHRYSCLTAVSAGGGVGACMATAVLQVPDKIKQPWIIARETVPALLEKQSITSVHFGADDGTETQRSGSRHNAGDRAKDAPKESGTACVLMLESFDRARLEAELPGLEKSLQRDFKLTSPVEWRSYDLSYAITQDEARKLVPFKQPKA